MANRNHYPSETETEPDRESVLGSREDLESHSRTGSETDDRSEDHRQSGDQSQSDSSQPGTRAPTPPAAGPKPFGPGDRVPWFPVPDDVEVLFHPWPSSLPLKCPRPPPGTTSIFPTLDALPECYSPFEDVSSGALFGHNFVGGCQHLITWTRTDLLSRISVDPWPAAFTSLMCLQQGALREITNTLISVWIAKTKEYSPMTEAELQGMFVEMATYAGHGVGDEERIICDGKIAFAFRSVSSRPPQHPKYNRIPGWLCKNTEPLGAKWKVSALWAQPLGLGAEIIVGQGRHLPPNPVLHPVISRVWCEQEHPKAPTPRFRPELEDGAEQYDDPDMDIYAEDGYHIPMNVSAYPTRGEEIQSENESTQRENDAESNSGLEEESREQSQYESGSETEASGTRM